MLLSVINLTLVTFSFGRWQITVTTVSFSFGLAIGKITVAKQHFLMVSLFMVDNCKLLK